MAKSLTERHLDEVLTDNTKIEKCKQCKDCILWGHTDNFGNAYDKSSCDMYPYPDHKPMSIVHNHAMCQFRTVNE